MHLVFHFAYLDPGTGSLIIQSLIGAIAGVAVFGRRMLAAIKMKFKKGEPSQTTDASKTKPEQTTKSDDKKN
jgi:hypothetical protein